ncbi:hypothetical protein MRB53_042015 [Persea americana]|nr:hypothetical protein MRB53_042015 [Persea americana]
MSRLSEPLKALINAAHARPGPVPAPANAFALYEKIAADAAAKKVGLPAWLCASVRRRMSPALIATRLDAS